MFSTADAMDRILFEKQASFDEDEVRLGLVSEWQTPPQKVKIILIRVIV